MQMHYAFWIFIDYNSSPVGPNSPIINLFPNFKIPVFILDASWYFSPAPYMSDKGAATASLTWPLEISTKSLCFYLFIPIMNESSFLEAPNISNPYQKSSRFYCDNNTIQNIPML